MVVKDRHFFYDFFGYCLCQGFSGHDLIEGHERHLFFEHNADYGSEKLGKWFVERKV